MFEKNKKYRKLLNDTRIMPGGKKIYRIRACRDIKDIGVKKGDLGGYIESDENLSHDGDAWVLGNAVVSGSARVLGNALVYGNARVSECAWVYGNTRVGESAWVHGCALVYGDAIVLGCAEVYGDAWVLGNAVVSRNGDYLCVRGLGSVHRATTAFKCVDGKIRIQCGCFYGTIDAFRKQVTGTRGGKIEKEYLKFAELVEIYFGLDKECENNDNE